MELVIAIFFSLVGAILGSFANVCIWRLPRGESVAWPPSHCPHCGESLKPWHLVPIFSWLLLRGKCAMCRGQIAVRYPLVEFSTAVIFGGIGYYWGISLTSAVYCLLTLALIISIGTDLSHREIPDQISLGASALLFIIALVTQNWNGLLGGLILFSFLFLVAVASRGGMGGGDIKLSLVIGLALGWRLGLVALAVGFLVGGILAIILLVRGNRGKMLPFGPFLALGSWIALFWGEFIIDSYWSISLLLWRW